MNLKPHRPAATYAGRVHTPVDRVGRLARASGAAGASVALAAAAHTAEHCTPPLLVTLGAVGALTALGYAGARREWRLAPLVTVVVAVQAGLHAVFTATCGAGPAADDHTATPAMLAAHLLAATIVALSLRRAERAMWRAFRVLGAAPGRVADRALRRLRAPELRRSRTPAALRPISAPPRTRARHERPLPLLTRGPPRAA